MPNQLKPLQAFEVLNQRFHIHGTSFDTRRGEAVLSAGKQVGGHTIFLLQGCVSLTRKTNNLLLGYVQAPFVTGLAAGIIENQEEYLMVTESVCRGYYLSAEAAASLLEQHQLWREAFQWLAWQVRVLQRRECQLVGSNSYNQIRATLLSMTGWEESLRARVGVMNYIQRSTHISRSVIAEVLAALREGEYIQMHKGKLVAVNRLPSDY
ncbi:helix-turn-helix domain-containing protein [Yokenella regensburgei]|uniref:helix-turn-helix domain-containing protein n=1 Tax=Yokenella regensburgei TaxID=158877 RepID=UPI00137624C6|nr:helix-turn-helix domain-containing protein [Yokenella regensburgei]KAF1368929.1 CRP-like cAMP-binding protein [Yokenella regensburgei]QIU91927.1 transcriptional regulator [Yokenella regensburgei]